MDRLSSRTVLGCKRDTEIRPMAGAAIGESWQTGVSTYTYSILSGPPKFNLGKTRALGGITTPHCLPIRQDSWTLWAELAPFVRPLNQPLTSLRGKPAGRPSVACHSRVDAYT